MKEVLYVVTVCDYDGIGAHLTSEVFTMKEDARGFFNENIARFINDEHSVRNDDGSVSTDFDDEDVSDYMAEYWWNNSTCYWQIKLEAVYPK